MAENKTVLYIIVAAIIIFAMNPDILSDIQATTEPEEPDTPPVDTGFSGTPTLYFAGSDFYNEGTSVGGTVYYWRDGVYGTTTLGATAISVNTGETFQAYASNGTSKTYYGRYQTHTVAQEPAKIWDFVMYKTATGTSLGTFVEAPNGALNTAANHYAMAASANEAFIWTVTGIYQESYGNPYVANGETKDGGTAMNIIVAESNLTTVDLVTIAGLGTTSAPSQHTLNSTGNTAWAFLSKPIVSNDKSVRTVTVKGNAGTQIYTNQTIKLNEYDADFYLHSITNALVQGVEMDNRTDIGNANPLVEYIHMD